MTTRNNASSPAPQLPSSPAELPEPEELMKVSEVSRRLRVDDTTVRRWVHNGVLDAIELPHRGKRRVFRVRRQVVDDLIKFGRTGVL